MPVLAVSWALRAERAGTGGAAVTRARAVGHWRPREKGGPSETETALLNDNSVRLLTDSRLSSDFGPWNNTRLCSELCRLRSDLVLSFAVW